MTRSWCNQKQIPKWETTKITNSKKTNGLPNEQLFVDLKLFVANAYSHISKGKSMHYQCIGISLMHCPSLTQGHNLYKL